MEQWQCWSYSRKGCLALRGKSSCEAVISDCSVQLLQKALLATEVRDCSSIWCKVGVRNDLRVPNFNYFPCLQTHIASAHLYAYQWYALPTTPGAWWGKRGELTYLNGASPHSWATKLHTSPYMSPTNTPQLLVVHSVWQGGMGVCEIHKKRFNTTERMCMLFEATIPSSINPSGKIPTAYAPGMKGRAYHW